MKASIREDNPVLFLLPTRRGGEQGEVPDGDHVVPLGKGSVKREGRDVTVVAIGVMVRHAMRAAATLSEEGIEVEVVDPMTLFPLDKELILASVRSEEHTSELQSLMRISYAVFCLTTQKTTKHI